MTAILAREWPDWVVGLLAGVFIIIGFTIMLGNLHRYQKLVGQLADTGKVEPIPTRLVLILTIVLQLATVAVN